MSRAQLLAFAAGTRAQLLAFAAALSANPDVAAIIATIIATALGGAPPSSTPTTYSQFDGQRPPWLPTRNLFLRAWGQLHREGNVGATAVGKTRLLTEAAAVSWRDRKAGPPRTKLAAKMVLSIVAPEEQVDRALAERFRVRPRKAVGK